MIERLTNWLLSKNKCPKCGKELTSEIIKERPFISADFHSSGTAKTIVYSCTCGYARTEEKHKTTGFSA